MDGVVKVVQIPQRTSPLGITVRDTPGQGVEVIAMEPSGLAAKAGIAVGDMLLKVNGVECVNHSQTIKVAHAPQRAPHP